MEHLVWARLVASTLLSLIGVFVILTGSGFTETLGVVICCLGAWRILLISMRGC